MISETTPIAEIKALAGSIIDDAVIVGTGLVGPLDVWLDGSMGILTIVLSYPDTVVFSATRTRSDVHVETYREGVWVEKLHEAAEAAHKLHFETHYSPVDDEELWDG